MSVCSEGLGRGSIFVSRGGLVIGLSRRKRANHRIPAAGCLLCTRHVFGRIGTDAPRLFGGERFCLQA